MYTPGWNVSCVRRSQAWIVALHIGKHLHLHAPYIVLLVVHAYLQGDKAYASLSMRQQAAAVSTAALCAKLSSTPVL